MAIGDRRFMGLVVAIVFLCIGVAVLGWANYSLGTSSDRIAKRVDELSRANGIKDQQLEQAGIPPSPLLAPTTTTTAAPEVSRTTTSERTPTAPARSTTTTTEHEPPSTSAPSAPSTTAAPATTTTTTRPPPSTTTTTRPCIVPVTIRPGGCP